MLVILDRDGVINEESHQYIKSPEEWRPIPGSLEAIAKLKKAGYKVVVATNQSGIGQGLYTEEVLAQIHNKMCQALATFGVELDGIFYCAHHPNDQCICRKPEPGLFLSIGQQFQVDLTQVRSVGDSLRDIQASIKVGARPVLVLTGNGQKTLKEIDNTAIPVFKDLAEATDKLLLTS